jgi:hypothetical protein
MINGFDHIKDALKKRENICSWEKEEINKT